MPFANPKDPKIVARRVRLRAEAYRLNVERTCSKCRKTMRVIDEETGFKNFTAHSVAADGLRPYCRFCERGYDKKKRIVQSELDKIKAKKRRAKLFTSSQFSPMHTKFWTIYDLRRYLGVSRMVIHALVSWRFSQVIPYELRLPTPAPQGRWTGCWMWRRDTILRWERTRFRPNAHLFFAYVRAWEKSQTPLADRKAKRRFWLDTRARE